MHIRLVPLTAAFLALAACGTASSEYSLVSLELDGSEGAALDEQNERVYTGMDEMLCDAGGDLDVTDIVMDGTEKPAVLDVSGSEVLYVDGGRLSVYDYVTGVATEVPDEGDVSDAQLTDGGVAVLDGCEVRFSSGAAVSLGGRDCDGELLAGEGLLVRVDGDGVYTLTPDGATRISAAHDVAWDALNRQWLLAEKDEVQGWTRQDGIVWSHTHRRDILDVFPLSGMVGFRDIDGQVHQLRPDGEGRSSEVYWLGLEGEVIGSVRPGTLAISNGGLTLLSFE